VTISVTSGDEGGTGSGVVLSKDGYILTNTHVVTLEGATANPTVQVQTSDGRLLDATIVGTDPIADLAVIKVKDVDDLVPATFADSSKLNVGDSAIAIGAPLGLAGTVTDGIVSSLNRSIQIASSAAPDSSDDSDQGDQGETPFDFWQFNEDGSDATQSSSSTTISLAVIQTDAAINPGNSGGALLDSDGNVIGINVAIASAGSSTSGQSGSIGVGFAIPSNLAKRIADEIIETGSATHGLLGASVLDVTEDEDSSDSGVVGAAIKEVVADGAADKAGLEVGDVITGVDGIHITGKTDLTAQVRALAAGSTATFTYVRDGKSAEVEVTLGTLTA
jgi:putative serine protease PepD